MSVYIFNLLNYYFFYNFYILLKLYEWIVNSDDEAEKCSLIVLGHLCCHPATRVVFFFCSMSIDFTLFCDWFNLTWCLFRVLDVTQTQIVDYVLHGVFCENILFKCQLIRLMFLSCVLVVHKVTWVTKCCFSELMHALKKKKLCKVMM